MLQTAWFCSSGGLCQSQSQPRKGSLGVGVCGLTTIHHLDSHDDVDAVTQKGAVLDRRPEIKADLDQRPEIIFLGCKYHVDTVQAFRHNKAVTSSERCPSSTSHLHYNIVLERVRLASHLITIIRNIFMREHKEEIPFKFVSVQSEYVRILDDLINQTMLNRHANTFKSLLDVFLFLA